MICSDITLRTIKLGLGLFKYQTVHVWKFRSGRKMASLIYLSSSEEVNYIDHAQSNLCTHSEHSSSHLPQLWSCAFPILPTLTSLFSALLPPPPPDIQPPSGLTNSHPWKRPTNVPFHLPPPSPPAQSCQTLSRFAKSPHGPTCLSNATHPHHTLIYLTWLPAQANMCTRRNLIYNHVA